MNQQSSFSLWRWARFSLRTLLVAITLFAVWIGWTMKRIREQERAVQRIQELGGTVTYDYQIDDAWNKVPFAEPPGPQWIRRLLGPQWRVKVVAVNLWNEDACRASDHDLEILHFLPNLMSLSLDSNEGITDDGLALLGQLKKIEQLQLDGTGITDDGLAYIEDLNRLRSLNLSRCKRIDGSGLKHLRRLPIHALNLNWTSVTDDNLAHLTELKQLEFLELLGTPITDQGLAHVAELRTLSEFNIRDTAVSDAGLKHLYALKALKSLNYGGTQVSKQGIDELRQMLPKLQ